MDLGRIGGILGLVDCYRTDIACVEGDPVILSDLDVGKLCLMLGLGTYGHPIGAQVALQKAIDHGAPWRVVVASAEELNRAPAGTIVCDDDGVVYMRSFDSVRGIADWDLFGTEQSVGTRHIRLPAVILLTPSAEEVLDAKETH